MPTLTHVQPVIFACVDAYLRDIKLLVWKLLKISDIDPLKFGTLVFSLGGKGHLPEALRYLLIYWKLRLHALCSLAWTTCKLIIWWWGQLGLTRNVCREMMHNQTSVHAVLASTPHWYGGSLTYRRTVCSISCTCRSDMSYLALECFLWACDL